MAHQTDDMHDDASLPNGNDAHGGAPKITLKSGNSRGAARATDRAEVLTTTFSTSDMGKLYMLLSKAMDGAAMEGAAE